MCSATFNCGAPQPYAMVGASYRGLTDVPEDAGTVERTRYFDLNLASCIPVLGAAFALIAALVHLVMAAGHAVAGNREKAMSALKWAGFRGCDVLTNIGITGGIVGILAYALFCPQRKKLAVISTDEYGRTRTETVSGYVKTTYS
ncbi:MAG: hypothetical protein ACOYKZ_00245 [Chlamydiia bacterium]